MAFRATALELSERDELSDDDAWAERAEYWDALATPSHPDFYLTKPKLRRPFVLGGHGVRLQIDHETLLIRLGRTRHPQAVREVRFFPGDPRLPSRIVLVDRPSGYLTFDVMSWLSNQDVSLVMLDWRGRVVSTISRDRRFPDPLLAEAQRAAQGTDLGSKVGAWLVQRKLGESIVTLTHFSASSRVTRAIDRIESLVQAVHNRAPTDVRELLIIEAKAAAAYFAAWQTVPIRWRDTKRRPIPPEWKRMPLRQSLLGGSNRNSGHPMSSALNYAYAVVQSSIREAISMVGLDPDISFIHKSRPGRGALVLDLIEPLRPIADRLILKLVADHPLSWGDVFLTTRGVCRLNPDFARAVVSIVRIDEQARSVCDELLRLV